MRVFFFVELLYHLVLINFIVEFMLPAPVKWHVDFNIVVVEYAIAVFQHVVSSVKVCLQYCFQVLCYLLVAKS